jgi:soluble lytic murein transglycosylase-like protein
LKKALLIILFALLPHSAQAFCFQEAGQRYAVSPWLLWAIAKAESNLNPPANHYNRNGTVDVGLMQINSIWSDQLGSTWESLDDPCTNVMVGAWVLSQCVQDYGYTWQAVGCYHSRTPTRRDAYAARIATILENEQRSLSQ